MGGANEMRMKQLPMLSYEVVISDQKFVIVVWRIFSQFQPPASLATFYICNVFILFLMIT